MPMPGSSTTVGLASTLRRRVLQRMFVVVRGIFRSIGFERRFDQKWNVIGIAARVPLQKHGPDLRTDEVVWAACAQVRKRLRALGVDELKHTLGVAEAADPALFAAHRAAQHRHYVCSNFSAVCMTLAFKAAKGSINLRQADDAR